MSDEWEQSIARLTRIEKIVTDMWEAAGIDHGFTPDKSLIHWWSVIIEHETRDITGKNKGTNEL